MCGFFANAILCVMMSIPPTMTAKKVDVIFETKYDRNERQQSIRFYLMKHTEPLRKQNHIPHFIPTEVPKASNCSEI